MFNGSTASTEDLQKLVDSIISADVELDRIFPGFGSATHKTYNGGQFVIGRSSVSHGKESTGSDWHCAPGNNYFIQVRERRERRCVDSFIH